MIYDNVECHCQMGNVVASVEIATASGHCFKLQVQQTNFVIILYLLPVVHNTMLQS